MATMDLNADLGEECGADDALLDIVTSANVAAGGHAGGGRVLADTVRTAADRGVAVGAHPSYPDREGFGRISRAAQFDAHGIRRFVREQVQAVAAACGDAGVGLSHAKAHGALYSDAATLPEVAEAVVSAVAEVALDLSRDPAALAVLGMPGTELERACRAAGVPFVAEAFADRAYTPAGGLVPRGEPGAVLHEPTIIAERVRLLATDGIVTAVDGSPVSLRADSICVHGDTDGAVEIARTVRRMLEEQGITVASWPRM